MSQCFKAINILLFTIHIVHIITAITNVNDFIYFNSGTTTKYQTYILASITNIYNEGYQYKDNFLGSNKWHTDQPLNYLFEMYANESIGTPSSGLRSSVPLGTIGQGIFELRGDGRFTDFTIFNNGPNSESSSFSAKWDLNQMLFGFTFNNSSKILQTSPYDESMTPYAIESLSYSGSFPVSKLTAIDNEWQLIGIKSVNLTAFSSFEAHNINKSSIPGVVFWFDIDNTDNPNDITMDFFFNFPDIIHFDNVSINNKQNGFIMNKLFNETDPNYFTTGNMSISIQSCNITNNKCDNPIYSNKYANDQLYENWQLFTGNNNNEMDDNIPNIGPVLPVIYAHYALLSKNITITANSTYSFSVVLSWFYPHRTWNNNRQYLGNYYNNLYNSSENVAEDILNNLDGIISSIASWHRLFNASMSQLYPNYLRDFFINAPSFIFRTGYLLEIIEDVNDIYNIWRQLESFSCSQVEPPHIHGYRSLSYNMLFNKILDRGTLNMYSYGLIDNGLVSEDFGGSCSSITCSECIMGLPNGSKRGEDNSIYVLNMYAHLKWYKDGINYVGNRYKYVKYAINWIINESRSNGYDLPYRLKNTFDEHDIIGDINTYSSMIYITALHSMKIMAKLYEKDNIIYHDELDIALQNAYASIKQRLWEPNDGEGFFRSFWCENGYYPQYGLQSDVLYGYLWSIILDLDQYWYRWIDKHDIISHIQQEKIRNLTPFGLQFMTNRTTISYDCNKNTAFNSKFKDRDTWEMSTFDHSVLSLYLFGDVDYGLSFNKIIINKYNNIYNDQWDYRDVSSTYNDSDPTYSRPVVNSHYSRQLIHYSLIWILNGIKLNCDIITNKLFLEIKPLISLTSNNDCIPILIPQSTFLLCLNKKKESFQLEGLFGNDKLFIIDFLSITNEEIQYNFTNVNITKGQTTALPMHLGINIFN